MEAAKREWELGRLQGLKEQEEREAELEEDDVLYTYSREDSENQVHKSSKNTKRKEKSKGTGGEKGVRETRQTRRDSREKSRRASGSREGSRTSSRGGSPPPVERQSRRVRSRASSGASGTDGDLSRRTRSRTSSGSGSDRLPSPRGGDRAVRMAVREKRRDTPRVDTAHKDSPRPVGRPRIRSADSAKSPERVLPKRKSSGSDPGVESKGKLRSSDRGSIFSNLKTRSRRRHKRSGSVSEGSKVSGNLEPVVETSSVRTDVAEESSEQNNHIAGQCQDKSHTENMNHIQDHDQSVSKDVEKRTRNIFDIVDTTMRIKERIKDAIRPASQGGTAVGNVLEKINTRNLFADLAKKFKKKNAPEISLPTHEENASDIRSNSETASINHHPVTDFANEIESSTVDEPVGERELVTENNDEAKMLVDSPKDNEAVVNECKTNETTPEVISVAKSLGPQPAAAIEELPVRTVPEDKETTPDVVSVDESPRPQPAAATEEVPVRIVPEDKNVKQNEDDIADVVDPERTPQTSGITPKASEVPEMISDSTEMADESEESKSENIMDQHMANIKVNIPTPTPLVESKDVVPLDASVTFDCEEENTQDAEMELVVDDAPITVEGDMKEKEVMPVVEEEIQTDSNIDQTLHTENEIPDSASHPTLIDNQALATQNVVEEEKHTGVEKLDEASTSEAPDVLMESSNNTQQATESLKEVEPVEEEKPMPVLSAETLVNVEKAELPQVVEKMPEIVVSSPYIQIGSSSPAAIPVIDTKDNSSKQAIEDTLVSNVGTNDDKADMHCDHPVEDVMEVDTEQGVEEVVVENKHDDETVKKPTENISESEGNEAKEQSDKGEEQENKDKEQGSTSEISMLNRVFVRIPLLDLSKINRDDKDGGHQGESTTYVEGSEDESSSKVDYNEEESIELSLPPKPTRRVREILNLTLPGEKPLNLDIDTPAARTRSRNTGDTVRTRSRVKPSSSPNVGGVSTPPRASPRSGGRGSTTKKTAESSSVIGAKRSPRPANSDSGTPSSMKRTLRSSDVS